MAVEGCRSNSEIPRIPYHELSLEEFQVRQLKTACKVIFNCKVPHMHHVVIWYFQEGLAASESCVTSFTSLFQRAKYLPFPTRYYMFQYHKKLQSCRLSKLENLDSNENSVFLGLST